MATIDDVRAARDGLIAWGYPELVDWLPEDTALSALSPSALKDVLDGCVVNGWRTRASPILSDATGELLDGARRACGVSDFAWEATLRRRGAFSICDLTGNDLLHLLAWLEQKGMAVHVFVSARRSVTPKQVQLLQVARKQTGMADEHYYPALTRYGGVTSATDLDGRGFELIIAVMEQAGFARSREPFRRSHAEIGGRPGFASPEQLGLIRDLWREWSGADDEAALAAWLERFHHVSALRFLTAAAAGKVITALKAMKRRGRQAATDGTAA